MPEKRIEKRKRKYLDYISLLKATGLTPKQAGDMDDFSRLLSSLDQYMDPENPKKIDKVTFAQVLNKYVAFQKKLESFEPSDAGKNVYEKFRKALADFFIKLSITAMKMNLICRICLSSRGQLHLR